MRGEIVSIGTEILLGQITDTNAPYLARHLADLGIDLFYISQVGDNQARVTGTLQTAWQRAEIIVMTGGLGPTEDDVTREAIAALLGETPQVDPELERELRTKFAALHSHMPERNLKQAWLIPSATALPNPVGTAPGWYAQQHDGHILIAMPGVPHEMQRMWAEQAMPRLRSVTGATLYTQILRVFGIGESAVEERLGDLIHGTNPTVATYAKADAVDVRISAKAATQAEAAALVYPIERQARELLGIAVYGTGDETLQRVVGKLLRARHWRFAALESCTGGLLTSLMTDEPGSSDYTRGGIVTYATDCKILMGVPQQVIDACGVISDETALAMARAAREQLQADVGVGITGVAGPEPQDGHPVGEVHIAIVSPQGVVAKTLHLRGARSHIKLRAALSALNLLRLHLLGQES